MGEPGGAELAMGGSDFSRRWRSEVFVELVVGSLVDGIVGFVELVEVFTQPLATVLGTAAAPVE